MNPAAPDFERELKRFAWKVEAGAEYAITQPVFDLDQLDRFLSGSRAFRIPIIAGIWPLVSLRNAEFLANEVPGVSVPDAVVERMRAASAGGKEEALAEGVRISREMLVAVADRVQGAQVSAPLGRVPVALEVLEAAPIVPARKSGIYSPDLRYVARPSPELRVPMQDLRSAAPALTALSEEENMFRDAVREFAETEVRPHVSAMDEAAQFRPDLIPKFFELGLMGIEVPEEYGGAGGGIFMSVLAIEELARVDASAAIYVDVQNTLVNNAFLRWGNDEQQRRYFPRLTRDLLGAFALSEPGSGSDAFALATQGRADAGRVGAHRAEVLDHERRRGRRVHRLRERRSVQGLQGYHGLHRRARVPRGSPSARRRTSSASARRAPPSSSSSSARCPRPTCSGPIGQGYKIAIETLNEGRIGIGAQMIGVATGALEAATAYVKERRQFGKAIAEFQGVQFQLAQMATDLEAARLMVYNAARLKDAGLPFAQQAAMAKLFSSQVADRTTSNCLELFGGYGYSKEYPVEKFYRDAKIGTIYEGTSNMQLQTIAKTMLK